MKQLKSEFIGKGQVKGFKFTQVKKTQHGYIYKVYDNNQVWYEVFKHRENRQFNCVSYPGTKSFGLWAWTCKTLEKALARLDQFENSSHE